jgi:hypothetical protein
VKQHNQHEITTVQRAPDGKWLSSGNPSGRPLGSRHRIAEMLLRDLADEWEKSGPAVLQKLAVDEPATFAKIAYGVLPKDVLVRVEHDNSISLLSDEEIAAALETIRKLRASDEAKLIDVMPEPSGELLPIQRQADED